MLWFYQIPNWQLGFIVIGVFTLLSIFGFVLTRKWVRSFKSHHNDVVSCFVATIGVLYAVLLAMIAVASWNNYTVVDSLVSQEADLVHAMFRDADAFPSPHRERFRSLLREYVDTVINVEWPSLQQGMEEKRAAMAVDAVYSEWVSFEPKTDKENVVATEIFQRLNTFQTVRRNRIQTGLSGLMPVLWGVVVVGAVLNLGMTYLFWMDDQKVHFVMTAVLGATIGMVVYLILALDHPLWGEVSVQPTAFEVVATSMDRALNPMTPGERRVTSNGGLPERP
jgi:heme/copper-type cytochrome/quinol oxidase subunit 2